MKTRQTLVLLVAIVFTGLGVLGCAQDVVEAPTQAAAHQRERLDQVRSSRDASKVKTVLNALEETARGDGNLMPRIIDAVQVNASLGEISGRLREVFGEHPP